MLSDANSECMGLVVSPAVATHKGTAYKQEHIINNKLADCNLNIDRFWTMPFLAHDDQREQRPLLYVGRIAFSMAHSLGNSVWRKSPLLTSAPQIGPLRAIKTGDMLTIEEVSETVVPSTSDTTTHMNLSEKTFQIGPHACCQILSKALDQVVAAGSS